MNTTLRNMMALLLFFVIALTTPSQARQTRLVPFLLRQGIESHSGYLGGGPTPQELAAWNKSDLLEKAGNRLLTDGNYIAAEADFREALALQPADGSSYAGLAEALDGQGRAAEAVQAYRILLTRYINSSSTATETRTQMGYAIALSQAGHWPEAVAVYEKALPNATNFGSAPKIDIHFDPRVPMPGQLQALAHIASGLQYTGTGETKKAYTEYYRAVHLDPGSAFANYYYGYGWQLLDPKDKARVSDAQQAKAALEKAVKFGKPDVKMAAQRALLVAAKL